MQVCARWAIDGDSITKILDISLVDDDHEFGLSPDGTELHAGGPASVTLKEGLDEQSTT